MSRRLRIFLSSPGDVRVEREVAALTIERLAQDYARFFEIESYLWEYEAMIASGHFQDSIEPPSKFDIVILILWSRLGTALPVRTTVREYRGVDGRAPVTGTEWEYEDALRGARDTGLPDILAYRSRKRATVDSWNASNRQLELDQLAALDTFWSRHFANTGPLHGSYTEFSSNAVFAATLEKQLRKLIDKRVAALEIGHDSTVHVWTKEPFRGLEAYEFDHAPIYFGQNEAVSNAMLELFGNAQGGTPFLLVLGASGSGKSSLCKAGILPKLFVPRRIAGAAFLRRITFRPSDALEGEDLFDALARKFSTQLSSGEGLSEIITQEVSVANLASHFRCSTDDAALPIRIVLGELASRSRLEGKMLEYESPKIVLFVDQLEELFTIEKIGTDERRRFAELLSTFVRSGIIWVVAAMRSDFWHRAVETPDLMRLAEGTGRLDLLPPSQSQINQMIRRPAEAAGVLFEVHETTSISLSEAIAEEVGNEPGALPLLSYLLDQLYRIDVRAKHGHVLTFASYENLGKLKGAIATRAEQVLNRCVPEVRDALGTVLFALVQMGNAEGTEGNVERAIARRIPLSSFPAGTPQRHLVEALLDVDARLLVSDAGAGGRPVICIAHEALITNWSRASDFVQKNSQALKDRRRIEERYLYWRALQDARRISDENEVGPSDRALARLKTLWARTGREEGLLSDSDLADGRRLLLRHRSDTEPQLVAYIERSQDDDQRIRRLSTNLLIAVAIAFALLAAGALVEGRVAFQRQKEAELQTLRTTLAQLRSLTQAAAEHLKLGDMVGTQGIVLEILNRSGSARGDVGFAVSVFQDARARDMQLAVLAKHGGGVRSAAYSPDGSRIVTSSVDGTVRIWDVVTGTQLMVLSGHGGAVNSANYSPDGRRIVTASNDKTARIWDATTGAQLAVLSGHSGAVNFVTYSNNGKKIVTASGDGTARIWNARTGSLIVVLKRHEDGVASAMFSPDDRHVITASADKTARIWDATTGLVLLTLSGHTSYVYFAAYSPDGGRIVTASADKTARIWDAVSGAQLAELVGHTDVVNSALFSSDGRQIVTASDDKTARIWDATTGTQLNVLSGHSDFVVAASYSPDNRLIVTASDDWTARIWDPHPKSQLSALLGHSDFVAWAAYSPDGRRIVSASSDKTARIWDATSGTQLAILLGHTDPIGRAVFSPDGRRIVTASSDNTARTWDVVTAKQVTALVGHGNSVESANYSPDGSRIVTASDDNTARIWDANTGKTLRVLRGHTGYVYSAAYSPDGLYIVTASADRTVRIWNAASGTQLAILFGHSDRVYSAVYSPDGRQVATASADNTSRIWNASTGTQIAVLYGHGGEVNSIAYSPDGRYVVTASADNTARIWDAITGTLLVALSGHRDHVESASFSPDGRRIVTASNDRSVRIWDATIPADLDSQIVWGESAEFDPLSNVERLELGLPPNAINRVWSKEASQCDQAASAPYDPYRRAPGVALEQVVADTALAFCVKELGVSNGSPRLEYLVARALIAKHELSRAKMELELAVSNGYPVAKIDLARLLVQASAGNPDPARAVRLYKMAWEERIPVSAFELGRLYEFGLYAHSSAAIQPDLNKAWYWYKRGADAREPTALARFGELEDSLAVLERGPNRKYAHLLKAFEYYAAATEGARNEDWPDEVWKAWRYRQATLARLLANKSMMKQIASVYRASHQTIASREATPTERLRQWFDEIFL